MSDKPGSRSGPNVHPDFDGHPEKPFEQMTDEERFVWAWRGMQMLHWARNEVQLKPREEPLRRAGSDGEAESNAR